MRLIVLGVFGLLTVAVWAQQEVPLPSAPQPVAMVRDVRWDKVEALVPGESVELRERSTGVRNECDLADVTDASLTCDVLDRRGPGRRIVYPHASIDRVWVIREGHGPSPKAILIGAGVGALLGGLAFRLRVRQELAAEFCLVAV